MMGFALYPFSSPALAHANPEGCVAKARLLMKIKKKKKKIFGLQNESYSENPFLDARA